ncbi:MAG: glycogen debranching protein [Actinophytocola sp.]|nr:glycogen debranching protein [Actinophytocola sp.]
MSETTRLADRRALVTGDRAIAMGDETGLFPASGWHIRGEMGGIWTPPVKLLDGIWFAVDDSWLGADVAATRYTAGWGYHRFDYADQDGLRVDRIDFAPDGVRANVIGVTLRSDSRRTVRLGMDAHSELMPNYPWGWTTPSAADVNLPDTGGYANGTLTFREQGTSPGTGAHDYAAVVGSSARPSGHELGPDHRGPQDPAVVCPAEGTAPAHCDDSAFGKGTGGRLNYDVSLKPGRSTTLWFTVAGSDQGPVAARAEFAKATKNPVGLLRSKVDGRLATAGHTKVDLPGDRLLQQSVEWSKQNLADSVQESHGLRLRDVDEGRAYPAPAGTLAEARWFGAGFPDYPWMFGTDGEYTAFAAVAAGQFEPIKAHLRGLRDVSEIVNAGSGKLVHEVVHTGDVYFGANDDAGNTDETVKFPSAVALVWRWTGDDRFRDDLYDFTVRNLRYVDENLDADGDGWLEGLGNVERPGMGEEKLDSTAYFVRGLLDLADMAASKGDGATETWARDRAADIQSEFEATWWAGGDANAYAESIDDPTDPANDNAPVFQRHWTGVTPMEIELPGGAPLASPDHGTTALAQREKDCYTGEFGLYHTGSGPTSAPEGNPGPSCDSVVSTVKSERATFTLNTGVMAVAEGNFGRLGPQRTYTTGNARVQLDPSVWETPGAMPEIVPSPDNVANIERPFYDRSMSLQAWGAYGILWPVVHQHLGVSPDLGNGRLSVVPQLPDGQTRISGSDIQVGKGSVDVEVKLHGTKLRTDVSLHRVRADLTVGAVLPAGAEPTRVTFDGRAVDYDVVRTTRGTEVRADVAKDGALEVSFR